MLDRGPSATYAIRFGSRPPQARGFWIGLAVALLCPMAQAASALQEVHFEHIVTPRGPSAGTLTSIVRDRTGFLWLGTTNGLLRYDGYTFETYRHDPADDQSISGNHIWSIAEDVNGDLWIGTSARGLNRYVRAEDRFQRYAHDPDDAGSLGGDREVPWVYRDRSDRIWIALWEDGLDRYDPSNARFLHYPMTLEDSEGVPRSSVQRIWEDNTGNLWLGTKRGLVRFGPEENSIELYRYDPSDPRSLGGDYVSALFEDDRGRLWVGSQGGGLSRHDPETDSFSVFRHDPADDSSISSDLVTAIAEDGQGYLWIGTEDQGLNRFDPNTGRFERFVAAPGRAGSLRSNRIASLHVDPRGILWIGMVAEGLSRYHPGRRRFAHHRLQDPSVGDSVEPPLRAIHERRDGKIWVGTAGGGLTLYDPETRQSRRYHDQSDTPRGSRIDSVSALAADEAGNLWIGAQGVGLCRLAAGESRIQCVGSHLEDLKRINTLLLDREGLLWIGTDGDAVSVYDTHTERFVFQGSDSDSPFSDLRHVWDLHEDRGGDVWIAVWGEGVCRYQRSAKELTCFKHDPEDPSSISGNAVISIAEDVRGHYWFGTWGEGLNEADPKLRQFTRYSSAHGLPHDTVFGILAPPGGGIWISTGDGLARLDPAGGSWRVFDRDDGLQSQEFRTGVHHQGRSGRLYFGGVNGLSVFSPSELRDNPHVPPVVLTSVQVFDRALPKALFSPTGEGPPEIHLAYDENFISFEFSALDFTDPQSNRYAYRLEGVDRDWVSSGNRRFASYTDLDPGRFVFRVKGSNNDGLWNESGVSLRLTIAPPPWKTWWAYTLYVLAGCGLLYTARRYELHRIRLANEVKLRRLEARKLLELDQLKSRFFANISHEFRTPLTLILGPLQKLLHESTQERAREQYRRMLRNGRSLLRLINELLDLSRLEAGRMTLHAKPHDLSAVIRALVASFESQAADRGIRLETALPEQPLVVSFDGDKFEKILSNLLSNALRFTPPGGSVSVAAKAAPASPGDRDEDLVQVSVHDSGVGIAAHLAERIFDRFYQVEGAGPSDQQGTGIGLALTKELVELHGGRISVISEPDQGSCFTVTLPIRSGVTSPISEPGATRGDDAPGRKFPEPPGAPASADTAQAGDRVQPVLLLVEDNPDMRAYIRETLGAGFRVLEAGDGEEGLERAFGTVPDLVVSDVVMPGMDGFDFCRRLKTDERSSHIPIILLTARADEQSRVEGLEYGADDYLTKPFSSRELLARVRNLIETRHRLRERFKRQITLEPGEITITTTDELFLRRALQIIQDNLSDSQFKVESFAAHFRLSRMQLHRKIKALTGQAVGEFIRHIRLQAAARLLKEQKHTVTEVAFEVGFNNLSYFARCFRRQFGVRPSQFGDSES